MTTSSLTLGLDQAAPPRYSDASCALKIRKPNSDLHVLCWQTATGKKIRWSGSNSTLIWQITTPAVHLSAFKELASLQFISIAFVQGLPCERMPVKFQVSAFFHFFSLQGKGEAQNKLTSDEK